MSRKAYQADYYQLTKADKRQVRVTLTPDEHAKLQELAAALEITPAQAVKRLAFGALKSERFVDMETRNEVKELSFLVRNISNNLNQIAKHSNRVQQVADENGVFDQLRELDDLVKRFVKHGP